MDRVKRTERGWAGHFCCSSRCLFRRNTLLEYRDIKIVVSTVGDMVYNGQIKEVGWNRFYETFVFHANTSDGYNNANVSRQIHLCGSGSFWSIDTPNSPMSANNMHENMVDFICGELLEGNTFE